MRRFLLRTTLAAVAAAVTLPATAGAATTVRFDVAGTASPFLFPATTITGIASSRREVGTIAISVQQDLGAILGGSVSFTSRRHTLTDAVVGGEWGPGAVGNTCAKSVLPISGVTAGGSTFAVTLTRYGSAATGSCVISRSIVRGTATLVFP